MNKIILYSKENCGPCSLVKTWLNHNGLKYEVKTLDDALEKGYRSVPITEFYNDYSFEFVVGNNIPLFKHMKDKYFGTV